MTKTSNFKIVLVNPQIHWNTGAIGRTCVGLDLELIIIHPCGFSFDAREIKRAAMDYWPHVQISHYDSWEDFISKCAPQDEELFFFSIHGKKTHFEGEYKEGCYLVFGSETSGLDESFHNNYKQRFYQLPMYSDKIRSLNLANTATAVAYEAIRQIKFSS